MCVLLAGLLAGVRVAVLQHSSDWRKELGSATVRHRKRSNDPRFRHPPIIAGELNHALHDARPAFVFVTDQTSALAAAIDTTQHPQLRQVLVIGDEFLGRSQLASFNVFVRNSRVPDAGSDFASIVPHSPSNRDALLLCSCDAIGRFRADRLSGAALLDSLRQHSLVVAAGPFRFSDVGLALSATVVERLLVHITHRTDVTSKL